MTKRIDAHMHVCQWFVKGEMDAFEALRRYQAENDIEAVDIMCCSNQANLWNGYEMDQNMLAAITKLEVPSTYAHGCMYIPDGPLPEGFDFVTQLEELRALGMDGIKFCEYKPDSYKVHDMDAREEDFEKYFAWCEKNSMPMCWHIADPDNFWDASKVPEWAKNTGWFYGDGSFPAWEKLYEKTYAILERHPDLHVMLAHAFFLSYRPEEVRALFRKYPRVTIDLAPGWEMFGGFYAHRDNWMDIFRAYSDRILFATDATMDSGLEHTGKLARNVIRFLATGDEFVTPGDHLTCGLALEPEHLEKILYTNAKRIVGQHSKPIDRAVLKEYIKKYLPMMPDSRNRQMIEEYYRNKLR